MDKPYSVTVFEGQAVKRELANIADNVEAAWAFAMSWLHKERADLRDHTLCITANGKSFSLPANVRPPWD